MKITRINADHWQITPTGRTKIATIARSTTAGQLNAIAQSSGLTLKEIGQIVTIICDREPHRAATIYGIQYQDSRAADLAQLLRRVRRARDAASTAA